MEEQTFSPTPSTKPASDKLFKISLIVLGLLIVFGLFGNIYLLLKKQTSPANQAFPSLAPTQSAATPTIDPTANWKTFIGKPVFAEDDWPQFTIKYPSEWEREGNILYPLGKNTDKKLEARVSLGFSIRILPEPQTKKVFPVGEMDYYWVKEGKQIFGYARIFKSDHSYFIVIENLPSQLENQYKQIFDQILSTFKFIDQKTEQVTIPKDWKEFTDQDQDFGVKTTLSLPPGYSFSFTGSEWIISNAEAKEYWSYSTSVLYQSKNYYTGASRRVWYQQYLNGEFSLVTPPIKEGEIIDTKEYSLGTGSYLEVTVKNLLRTGIIEKHYLHVQNSILHIIKPSSDAAESADSIIAKNMGIIFYSLKSSIIK